jgi:hypothetical protein
VSTNPLNANEVLCSAKLRNHKMNPRVQPTNTPSQLDGTHLPRKRPAAIPHSPAFIVSVAEITNSLHALHSAVWDASTAEKTTSTTTTNASARRTKDSGAAEHSCL